MAHASIAICPLLFPAKGFIRWRDKRQTMAYYLSVRPSNARKYAGIHAEIQ